MIVKERGGQHELVGTTHLFLLPFGIWGDEVSIGPDRMGTEAGLPCRVPWKMSGNFLTEAIVGRG